MTSKSTSRTRGTGEGRRRRRETNSYFERGSVPGNTVAVALSSSHKCWMATSAEWFSMWCKRVVRVAVCGLGIDNLRYRLTVVSGTPNASTISAYFVLPA